MITAPTELDLATMRLEKWRARLTWAEGLERKGEPLTPQKMRSYRDEFNDAVAHRAQLRKEEPA